MDPLSDYDYRSNYDLVREISLILKELQKRGFTVTLADGEIQIEEDEDE